MLRILAASEQAAKLCSEMLAYAGKEQAYKASLDLSRMVEHNAALLRSSIPKKIELICDLPSDLPKVLGDEAQLMQIVMNFITNAAEAIGDEVGAISISATAKTFTHSEIAAIWADADLPAGDYVVLEIKDTGCGMDKVTMKQVFEPFFTTKFTGRGLGLSAVHGIVKSHGAALAVESEPGAGSVFRVIFPASKEEPAVEEEKAGADAPPVAGIALLVDDEAALLDVLGNIFKHMGYEVIKAVDGVDALQKLKANLDEIGVVLMDITMPRMDGTEAYGHMRHIKPDLPIIICSGYSESDISSRFIEDEKLHFVRKPYRVDQIASKLIEAIGA